MKGIRFEKFNLAISCLKSAADYQRLAIFSNFVRGGLQDVDTLAERHKNLVGDILERRQARLERAQEYFIINGWDKRIFHFRISGVLVRKSL